MALVHRGGAELITIFTLFPFLTNKTTIHTNTPGRQFALFPLVSENQTMITLLVCFVA